MFLVVKTANAPLIFQILDFKDLDIRNLYVKYQSLVPNNGKDIDPVKVLSTVHRQRQWRRQGYDINSLEFCLLS